MRCALVAFLVAGCVSQDGGRSPLLPSEFHLFGSRSWADTDGSLGTSRDPWRFNSESETDGYALGAGFTWLIGPPPTDPALRELVREIKASRIAAAQPGAPFRVDLPVAVTVQPVPAEPVPPAVDAGGPAGAPDPDHTHDPGQGPSGPVPVSIEGAREDVWLKLLGSLALLVTAAAGYLGRERIPVVKRYTSKGRDLARLARLEAELGELQDEEAGEPE